MDKYTMGTLTHLCLQNENDYYTLTLTLQTVLTNLENEQDLKDCKQDNEERCG